MSGVNNNESSIVNVAWGSLLDTPLARQILSNTDGVPLCQVIDELLLASLQRDRGFGVPQLSASNVVRLVTGVQAFAAGGGNQQTRSVVVPTAVSGFQRWSRADFPEPPPTAYIPQYGAVTTAVDMGILASIPTTSGESGVLHNDDDNGEVKDEDMKDDVKKEVKEESDGMRDMKDDVKKEVKEESDGMRDDVEVKVEVEEENEGDDDMADDEARKVA